MYLNPYELEKRSEQQQRDIEKMSKEAYKEENRAKKQRFPSWTRRLLLAISSIFQGK